MQDRIQAMRIVISARWSRQIIAGTLTPTQTSTAIATATATSDPNGIPTNLRARAGINSVRLDWNAPSLEPNGYLVRRRLQGEAEYEELAPISADEVDDPTTLTDDTVTEAGTYEYTVQSVYNDGSTYEPSAPVTVTVREEDLATATATVTATATNTAAPSDTNTPTAINTALPSASGTATAIPTLSNVCTIGDASGSDGAFTHAKYLRSPESYVELLDNADDGAFWWRRRTGRPTVLEQFVGPNPENKLVNRWWSQVWEYLYTVDGQEYSGKLAFARQFRMARRLHVIAGRAELYAIGGRPSDI